MWGATPGGWGAVGGHEYHLVRGCRSGAGRVSAATSKDTNKCTQMKMLILTAPPSSSGILHAWPAVYLGVLCEAHVGGGRGEVSVEREWNQCSQNSS